MFVYEPFQQCVYGNALPPGFISKTCFDLSRNLCSGSAVSPPSVASLSNSSSRRLDPQIPARSVIAVTKVTAFFCATAVAGTSSCIERGKRAAYRKNFNNMAKSRRVGPEGRRVQSANSNSGAAP